MDPTSLAVVVRSAGERTAEVCCKLLSNQMPDVPIEVVRERPFEAALERTYRLGIEIGADWTVTVDADVLMRKGAIAELRAAAEAMPAHFFHLEGRIHDKITGLFRWAGHRIYRTSMLPEALPLVPGPGEQIRPEFSVLEKMAVKGYPSRRSGLIMGLHDYEQYYRDLYRKAFVHANKHPELIGLLVERSKAGLEQDMDFKLVLQGLWDGLQHSGPVLIDTAAYPKEFKSILNDKAEEEKAPLVFDSISFDDVWRWLSMAGAPPDYAGSDLGSDAKWVRAKRKPKSDGPRVSESKLRREVARAHRQLSIFFDQQGRKDEALAAVRRAIECDTDDAALFNHLGRLLQKHGKFDEAECAYRRALELKPDFARAHRQMSAILAKQGRQEEAVVAARRAIEYDPGNAHFHRHLSNLIQRQGKRNEARDAHRRARELEPSSFQRRLRSKIGRALWPSGRRGPLDSRRPKKFPNTSQE